MKKLLIFSILSLSVLLGPSVVPSSVQIDDAYHYLDFRDGRHDASYIEWWYFNLFSKDVQVVVSYLIINPDDILGRGLAGVVAVAYTEDGTVSEVNYFDPDDFHVSHNEVDVRIPDVESPPNFIYVNDDNSYRIVGNIDNGPGHHISWNLTYAPETNPWFARDQEKWVSSAGK